MKQLIPDLLSRASVDLLKLTDRIVTCTVPEIDRRRTPIRAVVAEAIFGILVFCFWMVYRIQMSVPEVLGTEFSREKAD